MSGGGKGRIVVNDIFSNGSAGIEVTDGSDPVVVRNRIHDSKGAGVVVRNGGKGKFRWNDIFASVRADVEIRDNGEPHLCVNIVSHGSEYGVFIHTSGRGIIEHNAAHRVVQYEIDFARRIGRPSISIQPGLKHDPCRNPEGRG